LLVVKITAVCSGWHCCQISI